MMKICPYCGEEIEENLIVCPECGESLKTKTTHIKLDKNILLKVSCVIVVLVFVIGVSISLWNIEDKNLKSYISSISVIAPSYKGNFYIYDDVYDLLIETKQEEDKLNNYLKELHLPSNKDKAFVSYYNKLLSVCEFFNYVNYSYPEDEFNHTISAFNAHLNKGNPDIFGDNYKTSIHMVPLMLNESEYQDSVNRIKTLKITKPQISCIKMSYDGEGVFVAEPNYEYLNSKYAKILSSTIRDYLTLKKQEEKDMNYHTYYQDGTVGVSRTILTNWIISWQGFKKKHPKFKPFDIDKTLNKYTSDFISSLYTTFNFDDTLLPKAKEDYEVFLKKVNPKTSEYKAVKKCYSVLKEHDYKYTNEFRICADEWRNKYDEE